MKSSARRELEHPRLRPSSPEGGREEASLNTPGEVSGRAVSQGTPEDPSSSAGEGWLPGTGEIVSAAPGGMLDQLFGQKLRDICR